MKREYDAIIPNVAGTNFIGYYKNGINFKLSDNTTVITIWKPGECTYSKEEVFEDAIIEMSGNATNRFTYQDMKKLHAAIEYAIDYLNQEPENKIDRDKVSSYNRVPKKETKKVKTIALKQSEIQVGGIYEDNKQKLWVYLGNGTLLEDNRTCNRGDGPGKPLTLIYMEYQENALLPIGYNSFRINSQATPDTYATRKRFFKKVSELDVDNTKPIVLANEWNVYQCLDGVLPSCERVRMSR